MNNLNASAFKIIPALSAVALAAAGSTNPQNLAGYEAATIMVYHGSTPATTGLTVKLERSATSDGTFAAFGASLPAVKTNNQFVARTFLVNTSATWHRVAYDGNNGGSHITTIHLLAHPGRTEPVASQNSAVTVYSDVTQG